MDNKTFNEELRKLIQEIIGPQKDKQKESETLTKTTKKQCKDAEEEDKITTKYLMDLRIYLKYILFDLEATKRERNSLKKQLNNQRTRNDDDDNEK